MREWRNWLKRMALKMPHRLMITLRVRLPSLVPITFLLLGKTMTTKENVLVTSSNKDTILVGGIKPHQQLIYGAINKKLPDGVKVMDIFPGTNPSVTKEQIEDQVMNVFSSLESGDFEELDLD